MTCILLLRHGHVAGITPKRFRGQMVGQAVVGEIAERMTERG